MKNTHIFILLMTAHQYTINAQPLSLAEISNQLGQLQSESVKYNTDINDGLTILLNEIKPMEKNLLDAFCKVKKAHADQNTVNTVLKNLIAVTGVRIELEHELSDFGKVCRETSHQEYLERSTLKAIASSIIRGSQLAISYATSLNLIAAVGVVNEIR